MKENEKQERKEYGDSGDAVIVGIASTTQLTIGSTAGLSGVAIAATTYTISQLPKYTIGDVKYSESASGTEDSYVYGVDSAETSALSNKLRTHSNTKKVLWCLLQ